MQRRQRGESLSARLRSEVQVSAALWQIGTSADKNAGTTDAKPEGTSRPAPTVLRGDGVYPCPREVKPLLFFYKYLQPIGAAEAIGTGSGEKVPTATSSLKKLRLNLPLTVVCERTNGQEAVLWLRTDANGNVVREEKTPLWRKKLHSELLSSTTSTDPQGHENDQVLAVRSVARWRSSTNTLNGGSAVVLTRKTLDPVLAVPCELPICVQQFVHCRGSQASVYRVFWFKQERKCFAVNLTSRYVVARTRTVLATAVATSVVDCLDCAARHVSVA